MDPKWAIEVVDGKLYLEQCQSLAEEYNHFLSESRKLRKQRKRGAESLSLQLS